MIGERYTVTCTVEEGMLACTIGSGDLRVFATPVMIALMEQASSELLARFLEPGQTSVGTAVEIAHLAPTPLGMEVTATAVITGQDGRMVSFEVTASDAQGEIGKGVHQRFIVPAEKFQAKADAKLKQA